MENPLSKVGIKNQIQVIARLLDFNQVPRGGRQGKIPLRQTDHPKQNYKTYTALRFAR